MVASAAKVEDEPQSDGALLLRDIAAIFTTPRGERINSSDLCDTLCALEDSPWGEWRGNKPISTRGVAQLLKPFGIKPIRDRAGSFYRMHDFDDAFARYLTAET
ncbi:DUF3631 domain-containing protein [Limimaricola variabilis]|nr:DUF3631 domain-containing protein [Limimaricola variabilis]WPY94597.1 DUF3631 domain-containing protein [Limimaricola variabilis]